MQKEFVTLDTETLLHLLITSAWTTERKDYQNEFPKNYRLVTQAQEKVRKLVMGGQTAKRIHDIIIQIFLKGGYTMGYFMNLLLMLLSSLLIVSSVAVANDAVIGTLCATSGSLGLFVSVFLLQTKGY